jgi:hypothetical protein
MSGSRAFSNAGPSIPHILRGHAFGAEITDMRVDLEAAFARLEGRDGYPVVTGVVAGSAMSAGTPGGAHAVKGTLLLQGQAFAQYAFGTGNAAVTVKANRPGEPGNALAVKIVQGVGAMTAVEAAGVLTVTLAAVGSTATDVAAVINASVTAKLDFYAVAGGTGGGTVLIASQVNLAGGVGEGLSVKVWGIEQQIVGFPTETSIPMVGVALAGAGATDIAELVVTSDGVTADPVSLVVVA